MIEIRKLTGIERAITRWLLILIVIIGIGDVLNIPLYFNVAYHRAHVLSLMFGLAGIYTFLAYPPYAKAARATRVPWYDWMLAALTVFATGYVFVKFNDLALSMGQLTPTRVAVGALGIFLCLEMVRRGTGMILVLTAAVFILYARYSDVMPDAIYARGSSWERIAQYLFLDPAGLFGIALDTITGVVLAFILFGNLLFKTGGGQFVNDVAVKLVGRFVGGPAKISVVSSSLFGTMTGSAAANVVFGAIITIPLMKKVGYRPAFAGAVEAVGASGGCLMPPVMGAAAFIMAEFLNVSYGTIALSAALPAFLYYLCVFMQVHFEAKRNNIGSLDETELGTVEGLWKGGILFSVPLAVLIYYLFYVNLPAQTGVMYSTGVLLVLTGVFHLDLLKPKEIFDLLEKTGGELIQMIAISAMAGLILGVVTLKGLGSTLSQALVMVSAGNAWVLLGLTAIACIILGMGLPAVPIYILLAVLVGPALVNFGVDPIAAHLFIFYFGILSYVTPPMAFACFVSGPLAGADPFSTGVQGMRLSIVAFIVPFLFVLHPELLFRGDPDLVIPIAISTSIGAICLAGAGSGYFIRYLSWPDRVILGAGALLLMVSLTYTVIPGVAILAGTTYWYYRTRHRVPVTDLQRA